MSYRSIVVDAIRPILPQTWSIIDYTETPDVRMNPIVMVVSTDIGPGVTAAKFNVTFHVYVLAPVHDSTARDMDAVDEAVLLSLRALLRMRAVTQGTAARIKYASKFPAWDITLNIEASVTDTPEQEE